MPPIANVRHVVTYRVLAEAIHRSGAVATLTLKISDIYLAVSQQIRSSGRLVHSMLMQKSVLAILIHEVWNNGWLWRNQAPAHLMRHTDMILCARDRNLGEHSNSFLDTPALP